MTAAIQQVESTPMRSKIGLWLGPLAFVLVLLFVDLDPNNPLVDSYGRGDIANGDMVDH